MYDTLGNSDALHMHMDEVRYLSFEERMELGLGKETYARYRSIENPEQKQNFLMNYLYKSEAHVDRLMDVFSIIPPGVCSVY